MERDQIERILRLSVGKTIKIAFGFQTEVVLVESVDADGFICRVKPADGVRPPAEFWVPYHEVTAIDDH